MKVLGHFFYKTMGHWLQAQVERVLATASWEKFNIILCYFFPT